MKKISTLGLMLVLAATFLSADSAFAKKPPPPPPPPKGECLCPDVFAPVICSDGVVYSNLCRAGCAGATGCVPTGDIAPASTEAAPSDVTPADSASTEATSLDAANTDTAFTEAAFTETAGRGCICPQIYAPVTCDNGKAYPNQCEADCHHAKNCTPSGGI